MGYSDTWKKQSDVSEDRPICRRRGARAALAVAGSFASLGCFRGLGFRIRFHRVLIGFWALIWFCRVLSGAQGLGLGGGFVAPGFYQGVFGV